MNIRDVQNKIAETHVEVADLIGKSVGEMLVIRRWFQPVTNNARVAIAANARRQMKERHRAEIAEMKLRHSAEIADLDTTKIVHEHIAHEIGIDIELFPSMVQGFEWLDEFERNAWAEYRGQNK